MHLRILEPLTGIVFGLTAAGWMIYLMTGSHHAGWFGAAACGVLAVWLARRH